MSTLQRQARALGDPTRHAIFRYIVDSDHATDVAELTSHFGFNHNAIRQHLAKLVDAGLVVESSASPSGRGRPRLLYRPDPSADSRWGTVGPFERLSRLLAEVVRTGDSPVEIGRRAVERARLGPTTTAAMSDPFDVIVEQMASSGFDPELRRRGDRAEIVLRTCPFASAAQIDPVTVCGLHLGMARGVADVVDGLVVDELATRDPRHGGCRLHCHLEPEVTT